MNHVYLYQMIIYLSTGKSICCYAYKKMRLNSFNFRCQIFELQLLQLLTFLDNICTIQNDTTSYIHLTQFLMFTFSNLFTSRGKDQLHESQKIHTLLDQCTCVFDWRAYFPHGIITMIKITNNNLPIRLIIDAFNSQLSNSSLSFLV